MTREQILMKVIEIAAEKGCVKVEEVTAATQFVNDLQYDSLTRVEFVMELEDQFEMSITDDAAEKVQTVGEAAELVFQMRQEQPVTR